MRQLRQAIIPGLTAVVAGIALGAADPAAAAGDGAALLQDKCGSCHAADASGALSRIAGQRKSPEGWLMTIVRMRLVHGIAVENAEQAEMVAHLSETQGLAPSETAGYRYILEREPAVVEDADPMLAGMCGRCHSVARVALQRRTLEEWSLHMDFHVGQYPTTEYQAGGRDREWFKIAKEEVAPALAKMLPFDDQAWTDWQAAAKPDPAGDWVFITRLPDQGPAFGKFTLERGDGGLRLSGSLRTAAGDDLPVSGKVRLYTGFEWRASLSIGGDSYRQVLALSADGNGLAGRQFRTGEDSLGGRFRAARLGGPTTILGAVPANLKAGNNGTVQVVGAGLTGLSFGDGVSASDIAANEFGAAAKLAAAAAGQGPVSIRAGAAAANDAFAVYGKLDALKVEPAFAIARVGGGGGSTAPVKAMFQAIGYLNGPDGQPGTDDDVRVGEVTSNWSVAAFDDIAEQMKDTAFAGTMDAAAGIFTPAAAGPNPDRPFSTNNAGNLKVLAQGEGLTGEAQLIVTVQRWNDPPIR